MIPGIAKEGTKEWSSLMYCQRLSYTMFKKNRPVHEILNAFREFSCS